MDDDDDGKEVDDEIPDISRVNIEEGEEEEVKIGRRRTTTTTTTMSLFQTWKTWKKKTRPLPHRRRKKQRRFIAYSNVRRVHYWDLYYQTPRVWLNGYDEQKIVSPNGVRRYKPIMKENVTIDSHPHTNVSSASVSKHASTKKLVKMITSGEEENEKLSVERYLAKAKFIIRDADIEYDFQLTIDHMDTDTFLIYYF